MLEMADPGNRNMYKTTPGEVSMSSTTRNKTRGKTTDRMQAAARRIDPLPREVFGTTTIRTFVTPLFT